MATPDYEFYTDVYKGVDIAPSDFDRLAARGDELVRHLIFGRDPGEHEHAFKLAVCAVAEVVQTYGQGGSGGITSEKIGSHAVSYAGTRASSQSQDVQAAAATHLENTNLLYRGI